MCAELSAGLVVQELIATGQRAEVAAVEQLQSHAFLNIAIWDPIADASPVHLEAGLSVWTWESYERQCAAACESVKMSGQAKEGFAYHGTMIHSVSPTEIQILRNTLIIVDATGKITSIEPGYKFARDGSETSAHLKSISQLLAPYQFIVPSFIDTHVHAPQFSMRGLGQGLHILDWLDKITFPHEAKFKDEVYAKRVYERCVAMALRQGITTACYFASLHTPATKILADVCLEKGQRAFVGKTCMDNPETNPDYYRETTESAVAGTREVIEHCQKIDPSGTHVRPIVTPRFAISCTEESMTGLGKLAKEHEKAYGQGSGILNQTHFSEAKQELEATLKQYPGHTCEATLYSKYGLFNENSVLAHCTHLTDTDMTSIKGHECGIAHCPVSNTTVGGGFMAATVRALFSEGITKIGLGTDSGGGFSCSIMDAMRQALIVSNARELLSGGTETHLGLEEVFYMATLGGARVLNMGDRVGSFQVGKQFDAIVVDMSSFEGVQTMEDDETDGEEGIRKVWEKWIMSGDDRNLKHVWVAGREVKGQAEAP